MGNEAAASDVLRRPPRPPREQLLDRATLRRVAVLGTAIAVACLLAGAYARHSGRPWQSVVFLALAFSQLAIALALRPRGAGIGGNSMLTGAVALNVGLALLAVIWGPLRELLHTTQLDAQEVMLCVLAAVGPGVVARIQAMRQRPAAPARPTRRDS
jgi:Ca2+-transporting ATPase